MKNKRKYCLAITLFVFPALGWAQTYLPQFNSAIEAQQNCPYDVVEQIDSKKAISRIKGQPKSVEPLGKGYVCRQAAIAAGYGGLLIHLQPLPAQAPPR